MNKVQLYGNITRDPALSYLPSQMPVCEFGVAVNEKRKQQDGSYKDVPCFVDVKCFGKKGEAINKYLKKGDPILIDGKLDFSSWQAQDGSNRSKLSVVVMNFHFVGGKKETQNNQQGGHNAHQQHDTAPEEQGNFYDKEPGDCTDLPF